jgi:hypothetical protein
MKPVFTRFAESNASLWILAASPALWAAQFLASYTVAAVWCGRLGDGTFGPVRAAILVFSLVALAGIAAIGVVAYGWHRAASRPTPHDTDTPEDRRAFMGVATLLLSGLSVVGVIYSALTVVFIGTCE